MEKLIGCALPALRELCNDPPGNLLGGDAILVYTVSMVYRVYMGCTYGI